VIVDADDDSYVPSADGSYAPSVDDDSTVIEDDAMENDGSDSEYDADSDYS